MKKVLVILCLVLVANIFAGDFTWMQLNLYEGVEMANAFGDTYMDTYFEVEGGGKTGVLDFYYFFDVNHVFGVTDDATEGDTPGVFFAKIAPRLSLTKMMGKEKCFGPFKENYVAMRYKGGNGFEDYAIGLGTDLAIPYVDMFSLNIYKLMTMAKDDENERSLEDGGIVIAINWYTKILKFSDDMHITYQGWADLGLMNNWSEDNGGEPSEFQMFNGFFYNYNKWSVSASVKLHNNFTYNSTENHDATSLFFGLHRRF